VRSKLSAFIDREGLSSSPGAAEAQIVRSYIAKIDIGEKLLVATPGLSDHGHGNAFDTQVFGDDHKKMAGIGACWVSTWDGPHQWKSKLKDAVMKSGEGRFQGPLSSPYEPWHYEYDYS
jgi:hypothetical protein